MSRAPRRRDRSSQDDATALGGGQLAAFGLFAGLIAGALLWSAQLRRHRRDLFSRSPYRRLAALGYLGGQRNAGTARLLRDYVRWESRPLLRRRGQRLLRRMEQDLD